MVLNHNDFSIIQKSTVIKNIRNQNMNKLRLYYEFD